VVLVIPRRDGGDIKAGRPGPQSLDVAHVSLHCFWRMDKAAGETLQRLWSLF
jgi:hypothetical protein